MHGNNTERSELDQKLHAIKSSQLRDPIRKCGAGEVAAIKCKNHPASGFIGLVHNFFLEAEPGADARRLHCTTFGPFVCSG
ncbi:Hypothetical predicted protein [Podarcis lilfordi]|uniref:Uncharacterized protein n=1 Tax=Podarcis lilfordi TaxID=74358 RepID=A0AA35PH07_9SAUR|nr:Hypothetical predicted protein [Podarcis lilfordi]